MLNLIEPPQYPDLFLRHPPVDFEAGADGDGLPFFGMDFDISTTLDPALAKRLRRVPLLRRLLRFKTRFVGTTITEYAPLPDSLPPQDVVACVLKSHSGQPLTIIKDIPLRSPFLSPEENDYADRLAREAEGKGFITVDGQALAYVPIDFSTVKEYLSRLSSGRRKDLSRKMKARERLDIRVVRLGDPALRDERVLDEYYEMFKAVYDQSDIHFDLLTKDFFRALLSGEYGAGVVMQYHAPDGLAGYNICLVNGKTLIDKYIGFKYPQARKLNLYFISWLYNLEFALDNGLSTYVAGWTDPEVKASLGARFTFTRHLVRVRNPALRAILHPFKRWFENDRNSMENA